MALIRGEAGAETVTRYLSSAIVSAVNLAEVQAKLVLAGMESETAWWHIWETKCPSIPFDEEQARVAGGLVGAMKHFGLSLGDRACLALAILRKATVYTADRAWKSLPLGIEIEVIR